MPYDPFADADQFRSYIADLSGKEKQALAQKMGVTNRTVQRWAVNPGSGKQSRSFLPARLKTLEPTKWPVGFKQRSNTQQVLREGLRRGMSAGLNTRTFSEKFSNVRDALRYMKALATGDVDKWLSSNWIRAHATKSPSGIEVHVEYASGFASNGAGGSVSGGDLLPPEGLLDTPGVDDPFGDVLLGSYNPS